MIILKKKILASLFSASILLSTMAPIVSIIYADEEIPDQTTEPEIPNESDIPIEEIPSESESNFEEESSSEISEEPDIPEETTESSVIIEEPNIPEETTESSSIIEEPIVSTEPTYPEEPEEIHQDSQSTSNSEETNESTQPISSTNEVEASKTNNALTAKKQVSKESKKDESATTKNKEKILVLSNNKQGVSNQSERKENSIWIADQPEDIGIKVGDTEYTIKWGDTLWAISIKAETTVEDLAKLNNIHNVDLIFAGESIQLK